MVFYTIPSTVGYWDTYNGQIELGTTLTLLQMIADAYDGANMALKHSNELGGNGMPNATFEFHNQPQRQVRSYLEQRRLLPPSPSPSPSRSVSQDTLMEHSEYNDSQVTLRPPPSSHKKWRVKARGLLIPHVNTSAKAKSAPTSPINGSFSSRWRISRDFTSKRRSLTHTVDTAFPASSASPSKPFDFFSEPPLDKDDDYDTPPSSPDTPISAPISPRVKRNRSLKVSTTIVLRREVERSKTPITPSRSASRRQRKSILLPDEDIWVKAVQMTPATPTPTSPMTLSRASVNVKSDSMPNSIVNLPHLDRPVQHVARQQVSLWTLLFLTGAGYLMVAMLVTLCVVVGVYRGAHRSATEVVRRVRAYRDRRTLSNEAKDA
ncbi:hypothetical protein CVT24_001963 [Panaeolus cyanescens]|uniref:Uncharacterized protein n=1 Tax=Panaeolus cyanescens TaxID=181874 RepID=A0A409YHN6_9AGAR|nr:hypothetical protein CVT24_001963 [Panaeolus cyanescens]